MNKVSQFKVNYYRRYKDLVKIFFGLGFRSLKLIVARSFGHAVQLKPIDKFLIFYLKRRFNLKKKPPYFKITSVSPHTEGPGSQALNVIHAINLATILKVPYVHTEFQTLAHADRPMSEWAQLWEQHFNLGMSETKFDDQDPEVINFAIIMHHVRYFFDIRDFKPAFNHTLPVFKKRYFQNKRKLKKNTATVNIAIHVRRGDITPKHTKMWTPVESLFVTNLSSEK